MPEKHRKYWDAKQFDGRRSRSWAANIGENTLYVVDRMLTATAIEEQAYKSCMGLLQLAKKYSSERLETACSKAKIINSCTYTTVVNIPKNGQDFVKAQVSGHARVTPVHDNVRGASYYM